MSLTGMYLIWVLRERKAQVGPTISKEMQDLILCSFSFLFQPLVPLFLPPLPPSCSLAMMLLSPWCRVPLARVNICGLFARFRTKVYNCFTHKVDKAGQVATMVNCRMLCRLACRSQWSRVLRRGSAVAGSNPAQGMDVCPLCLYGVLSCVGRGLCVGLITRPEESYRVSLCVRDQKTPKGALCSKLGTKGKMNAGLPKLTKYATCDTIDLSLS
jgi:hypothetical protein